MHPLMTLIAMISLGASLDDATIRVDAGKILNRVSPLMYGSCIEDVNHEIYGGLYAQMIFGESFEEPPSGVGVAGWTSFGGTWSLKDATLSVTADAGAKAVLDRPAVATAIVSCEVRLRDDKGGNAGLILRVREPKTGADNWIGDEVSISASGQHLILGRHHRDWKPLKQVAAKIVPGRWHKIRVEMQEGLLAVYLDDAPQPAIVHVDMMSEMIPSGLVGVRTWNSDADFRNFVVERREGKTVERFEPSPATGTGGVWKLVRTGDAVPALARDDSRPYNSAHSQRIEIVGGSGTVGLSNRGLNDWGLTFRAGHEYAGRLYLRREGYAGQVTVALQSGDGSQTYASQKLGPIGDDWSRFDFSLKSSATDTNARLALWIDGPGKVWVDQVTLTGTGEELFHGLPYRADIARALQDQGLTLLRYGGSMVNAPEYRWKKMIGDRDLRPQYKGWWYPYSTNGFGIIDFVRFCREAGFEPVVTINIEESPADAADLVEYLNGPASSPWGKRRAEDGHPEPFRVQYIEIGNEETTNAHYIDRFQILYEAMRPRDPNVSYIIGAWWEPDNPISRRIVRELNGKAALWDVHVGGDDPREGDKVDATFTRMRYLVSIWAPGTALKACVLEENGGKHDLARALGHAGILNATQRHGDFVLIDCPANCLQPWRQNDNGWDQGQLFFTSSQVWGMPPYYAQKMAATAHQPCRVDSEVVSPGNDLDLTATRDENGATLALKVVNAGDQPHTATITLTGFGPVAARGEATTLAGALGDRNTPEAPDRIKPVTTVIDVTTTPFSREFPARSYTILTLHRR